MSDKEKIILPPKYYLDYFKEVLAFIEKHSGHLLDIDDHQFYEIFHSLSEDAQCTIIRMANRKGEYFRMDKFEYPEISHQAEAFVELAEAGFSTMDINNDPIIFNQFTKAELDKAFPDKDFRHKYKEEVVLTLVETSTSEDYHHLLSKYQLVKILIQDHIEFLKLLYFGNTDSMMTEFVIRDVGNIQLENLENHQFSSWFSSRSEALAVFELSKWNTAIKLAFDNYLPEEILQFLAPVNWSSLLQYPAAQKIGNKLMMRIGEYYEKMGFLESAISFFEWAKKHPARERRIRIMDKIGRKEDALDLAAFVTEQPYNAKELTFACDYIAKKGDRILKSTTTKIKSSPSISLVPNPTQKVEAQALAYFAKKGFDGIHSENFIWRNLFGLTFWHELFDNINGTFHHPLQRMPSDLYSEAFYLERKIQLEQRISTFRTRKQYLKHIEKIIKEKSGITNPFIYWHEQMMDYIGLIVERLPFAGLKKIMLEIAKNVKDNSTGFPDLFIWNETEYFFYEIKSPNDHLSAQQLFWINFLEKQKVNAQILRLIYLDSEES
ncbi:MAG: VRR-NUC domain-containing protein [Cyclobacteriaceae bacterium]